MSAIASQKQCLVIGKRPLDWPEGWSFPGPNPPGWPKATPENFEFIVRYENAILSIQCRDEFKEPTDLMVGQCFEVCAWGEKGGTVRLRQSAEQPWSRRATIHITAPELSVPMEFETGWLGGEKAFIRVDLFGHHLILRAEIVL